METKKCFIKVLPLCLLLFFFTKATAQYQLSVPFNEGFVGDNTAQNVSSNSKYLTSLGWSNIQFAQNSSATTFVSQGNDIVGFVLITDNNGVEHSIPGFVKWRAPSGTVTALVFSPSTTVTLATNGSNGSSSYTVSATKYVGLIFNDQTLSIPSTGSNAGKVSGNAATTGLLDQLNTYLAAFPYLSVPNYSVYESAGKVLVTLSLSASSAYTVSAYYTTSDSTALSSSDYTTKTGTVSFAPGELAKTIEFSITSDANVEGTEYFKVTFSDAKNASIQKGMSTVTVWDDSPLGVDLVSFNAACENGLVHVSWTTASEHNSDYFSLVKLSDSGDWMEIAQVPAQGNSTELTAYAVEDRSVSSEGVYQLIQYDMDGTLTKFSPVNVECRASEETIYEVYPNPSQGEITLKIDWKRADQTAQITVVELQGGTVYQNEISVSSGVNVHYIDLSELKSGTYLLQTNLDSKIQTQRIVIQ
ncbi:MAG: hypothetical protein RIT43_1549 [Bacteroidota bacterium]